MDQTRPLQLPPDLAHAAQRVRQAARQAAERAVQGLGAAAQASRPAVLRDQLLGAQPELKRQLSLFSIDFDTALDTELARQLGLLQPTPPPRLMPQGPPAPIEDWAAMSLVDDAEVELHIAAGRWAQEIHHAAGWALRDFDACMARLLGLDAPDPARNPLRAEVVAKAMVQAIHGLRPRPEHRGLWLAEVGRALVSVLPQAYLDILSDWRACGIQPLAPVRPAGQAPSQRPPPPPSPPPPPDPPTQQPPALPSVQGRQVATQSGRPQHAGDEPSSAAGGSLNDLLAQLQHLQHLGALRADAPPVGQITPQAATAVAPNLIRQHREALREAAPAPLNHLVIDLVAGLFDQILADPQVPPQFARQIARLQMPVLRAALADSGFFSSRTHPVRLLVNRIATLATAATLADGEAQADLLAQVQTVVQAVVQAAVGGPLEHSALCAQQLQVLDRFAEAQAARRRAALGDAPDLLARKEHEQACQAHFAQALDQALAPLPLPSFLRVFMTQVWGRLIVRTNLDEGPDSPPLQRLRATGRDLALSVQPKGAPAQRQLFLQRLPQLMKDLHQGLDQARCPITQRHDFFARLLPAHAQALKQPPLSTLAYNLLSRQLEAALAQPVAPGSPCEPHVTQWAPPPPMQAASPPADDGGPDTLPDPCPAGLAEASFTPAEAQALGWVDESSVAWQTSVDIDLDLAPELGAVDIAIDGLPAPDAPPPSRGPGLAEHLQVGLAYQMLLQGQWQAVTLAHISPNRGFYLFNPGQGTGGAVSMTRRMLLRLCEAGRLRALENADLIARATARARQQLAELNRPPTH